MYSTKILCLISFVIVCGGDAFDSESLSVYVAFCTLTQRFTFGKTFTRIFERWNFRTFIVSCFACDKCDALLEYAYPAYCTVWMCVSIGESMSMCVFRVFVWNIHRISHCFACFNVLFNSRIHAIFSFAPQTDSSISRKCYLNQFMQNVFCSLILLLLLLLLIRCLYCACAWCVFSFIFCSYCYVTCIWEIRKRKSHTVHVFSRLFSAH